MALVYYAGIDTADFADGLAVTIGGAVGSGTATVASGTYIAGDNSDVTTITTPPISSGYGAFIDAVYDALNAAVASSWTVTWNESTLAYTISNPTAFTLTFGGTAGQNLSRALGMSLFISSTTSTTSTVRPYYVIQAEIDARSDVSDHYEADDNVEEAIADGGSPYSVSRDTEELRDDWVQSMEPIEAVMSRSAAASVPWTWQHFVTHLRASVPFYTSDTTSGAKSVYVLRAEGASWSSTVRERVVRDWDGLWNIRLSTRFLGDI